MEEENHEKEKVSDVVLFGIGLVAIFLITIFFMMSVG